MKKKIFFLFLQLLTIIAFAQEDKHYHCATDEHHFFRLKSDREYERKFNLMNESWQKFALKKIENDISLQRSPTNPVTLSVVFHDLSNSSTFLTSSSSILDYQYIIDKLNLIYDGTNLNGTPGNNSYINFCVAQKDINGNAYTATLSRVNGILVAGNLDKNNTAHLNSIIAASNTLTKFPTKKFINVYIVDNIVGAAGFATLPSSHGTNTDGIYVSRQYLVNDANINTNMNVLAHEMGHYLGLFHTFGICDPSIIANYPDCSCDNDNCLFNGDMICDTQPNKLHTIGYTCLPSTFPNTCTDIIPTITDGTHPTSEVSDPKQNYMDYGNWNCQYLFTNGQIERMNFMVDPDFGPRKSLLGQSECVDCIALNNCTFSIIPNVTLPNPRHEIIQISSGTPQVQFNPNMSCTPTSANTVNYSWSLELLGSPNQMIFQNVVAANYTTPASLSPGNYQLTLTATLQSNNNCVETAVYNFCIYPMADSCNLSVPLTNNSTDWINGNWQRESSENGWVIIGGSYPIGSSQYSDGQPGFDNSAYDVIPLSAGGTISDPNFNAITLPTNANINQVIRVGKTSGGGAKAFYAKITIPVNSNNCKYRIWYLGQTEGLQSNIAYPFINNNTNNDASFGWVCKYSYNSPVNTSTVNHNSLIGYNDTNLSYDKNDMVSLRWNSNAIDFTNINGYRRMTGWKYMDVDFSEFVNLTPNTTITLTFFAHSNIATNALQEAYSYFGMECLGGGIPTDFNFDIEDKSISCTSPGTQNCTQLEIPIPFYDNFSPNGNTSYNFINYKFYKKLPDGSYSSTPYPANLIAVNTTTRKLTVSICFNHDDAPYQDFKIVYKTLHGTLEDTFRIFIGFYNNLTECTEGDKIDEIFHPNITNGDILICDINNLPELHLTETCIEEPHTYQWYYGHPPGGIIIPGATNASLQLLNNPATPNSLNISNNYILNNCNVYHRKTLYKEPYCDNPKVKISDKFTVYNNSFRLNGLASDNDICLGDIYQLKIENPNIQSSCRIPLHLYNLTDLNNLSFQMYDPVSQQHIGNINNFSFNGQINATNANPLQITPNPLVFTFDNINPSTGNFLFVPTSTQTSFPINLHITGNYLGCPIDIMLTNYQHINFRQSAQGGIISFNCSTNEIENIDSGVTNGNIYNWEYSNDGITFVPISGSPNSSNLPSSIVNTLSSIYSPLYIRRVSLGFINCPNLAYSNIIIRTNISSTIEFTLPNSICNGSQAPLLPTESDNGIIGSWNVLTASNTESATYSFTPLSGYCLPNYTYNLVVTDEIVATFEQIEELCYGTNFTLPTTSTNGITGTWSPAINNLQTTTYTFTPDVAACSSSPVTMTVVINQGIIPIFDIPNSICQGSFAPILPNESENGIQGTWTPNTINNLTSETYTFTPNTGQCVQIITKHINILTECELILEWGSDVSCQLGDESSGIKFDEEIVDGPCIRVCENSIILYSINGNITNINFTEWNVIGGTVLTSSNTSCEIEWGSASYSAIQAIVHYNDGTIKQISRCVEKLNGPEALFGVLPNVNETQVTVCVDNVIVFDNLTTSNNGHDNIYYNWDFGDGITSNEFEPTHIYTQTGTFEVTLVAFNGCSCVGSYSIKIKVEEGIPQIQCPTVICEGDRATYILPKEFGEKCHIEWTVNGGDIVFTSQDNTEIDVIWNNVDQSGFGIVNAHAPECYKCISTIKVPVIQNKGTIFGSNELCEKAQGLYALPQWPTTEFNWTIDDAGTGAILIPNNQRNEVIVRAGYSGTITLYCSYYNTLLGCGGNAEYSINVKPTAFLDGNESTCVNSTETFDFVTIDGTTIPTINWIVTGSNGFSQSGNGSPFNFTFPQAGVYYISVDDVNYCGTFRNIITVNNKPDAPTAINGASYICPGIPTTFSCVVPNNTIAHWEIQNGTIIGATTGNEITVNFSPTATTPYLIKVRYEKNGCLSDEFIKTVTRDTPTINFNQGDNSVCGSSYATYTIDPINVDNYIWSIFPASAGSIQSGQNSNSISILWNQEQGTADVKVEVRKCGATYSSIYSVDIISHGEVSANIPNEACLSNNFNVDFNVLGNGTFTSAIWNFGDGTPPVTIYPPNTTTTHTYNEPITNSTTFNVTLTVFNAGGCSMPVIITQPVIVSPSPIIEMSPKKNLNYCHPANIPEDYTYTVNIQNGFGFTNTIEWFQNGVSYANTASITIPDPGTSTDTYYAVVTNSLNCSATTQSFDVVNNCLTGCGPYQTLQGVSEVIDCQTIKVTPTIIGGSPTSIFWSNTNLPGANILQNNASEFIAENVEPGEYSITLNANYNVDGTNCSQQQNVPVIVPYKARLKYNIECTNNNLYTVTLLDHSVYYAETPIQYFAFTYDGGANWYSPTSFIGNIPQFTIQLPPGNYNVGVKIWNNSYPACEKIETLNLPAFPIATFTSDPSVCQRDGLQFIADDTTPGLQYHWSFFEDGDFSSNLQQNPIKSFSGINNNLVTLTVINRLGCSATHTVGINVIENNIAGKLKVNPESVCAGGSMELSFEPIPGIPTQTPSTLYWYHNEHTATPFAITHEPNLNLLVNQPGQYFAYGENANGCIEYMKIEPTTALFLPAPASPVVNGPIVSCLSSEIHLTVPQNSIFRYIWSLNGTVQPSWDNLAAINYFPTATGTYTFEVMAQIQAANGQWCNGATSTHVVTVIAEPETPELNFQVISCSPYKVMATVQNPQAGVNYYWSNGDTGTTAIITHDGPLQVRAELNGCSITEQLDLPVDLETLAWIFPKGCMTICSEENGGYLIGPFGDFEKWVWLENGNVNQYGSGNVANFYDATPINLYELYLETPYCKTTWGILEMNKVECEECKIENRIESIKCVKVNGVYVYELNFNFYNNTGVPLTVNISVPGGEGYFSTSSFTLPPMLNSQQTLYFYPANGFSDGVINYSINGTSEKGDCILKAEIEFQKCDDTSGKHIDYVPKENIILIAPNPTKTNTNLHYQLIDVGNVTIEMYDATGRALWQTTKNDNKGSVVIDCEKYASGYYSIYVKQNGMIVHQSKLIIQ